MQDRDGEKNLTDLRARHLGTSVFKKTRFYRKHAARMHGVLKETMHTCRFRILKILSYSLQARF